MTTPVERFLSAGFADRIAMVIDDTTADGLRGYLGQDAFAEYRRLAAEFDEQHLAGGSPVNLLFLPGVMGSSLASRGLGGIWWLDLMNRGHIGDLRLASDGVSDADPRARIEPVAVMPSYEGFLAAVFATGDLHHETYAYDWRKPLRAGVNELRDEIVARSSSVGGPIHLVAHSMGGLLLRAALMAHPEMWAHVGRVVFVGTPHFGSPAIAGYLKNHLWGFELLALLGRYLDRPAFRSLRGVLNLLPAPAGVYPGTTVERPLLHPCANFDMYDADAWRLGLTGQEHDQLQATLDDTAELYRSLHTWHLGLDAELRERMAVTAGVGYKTLFRLGYHQGFGFQWRAMDRTTEREPGDLNREGDGRVPLASAQLPGVETRYVRGEHGRLPTIPAVSADVFRFLRGRPMQLPRSPAEALDSDHLAEPTATTTPVLASTGEVASGDDPGYLNMEEVDAGTLDALDAEVAGGTLPAFTRIRVL